MQHNAPSRGPEHAGGGALAWGGLGGVRGRDADIWNVLESAHDMWGETHREREVSGGIGQARTIDTKI